jgi:hypothetical protein
VSSSMSAAVVFVALSSPMEVAATP